MQHALMMCYPCLRTGVAHFADPDSDNLGERVPARDTFIVNVEVAVIREGRYLAIVRAGMESFGAGWLGFPGGKVDIGDSGQRTLEETARREVREEVGINLDEPIVYVESHTFAIVATPVLDVVMLARSSTGEPFPASPDEVAGVEWMPYETFMSDPRAQTWTRDSLRLAENKRRELGW